MAERSFHKDTPQGHIDFIHVTSMSIITEKAGFVNPCFFCCPFVVL